MQLRRLLQAVFFEAHQAQRRVIEDWQLDSAALQLDIPNRLAIILESRASAPFQSFDGRPEVGHFVEAMGEKGKGKRGVISKDDKSSNPYKVQYADGEESGWLKPSEIRSSGLSEAAFLAHVAARQAEELRSACSHLPAPSSSALIELRWLVGLDQLPLLSLLQADPLQLQSSHLSFQEYFAARAICDGARLTGPPPWKWPAWWANTVAFGAEMGDNFGKGLLLSAGVEGDSLDLIGKLGGDMETALRAVLQMATALKSLRCVQDVISIHCYLCDTSARMS